MSASTSYGRGQRLLEYASIALFVLLAAWSLWRLALAGGAVLPLALLVAIPCGWIASDLFSGLLHFAFDTWGSVKTPVIGSAFIRPFREHHADPEAMTRLVRLAQRWRLALPREHHRRHHTPPFDTHFCISCGWLNPAFDFLIKVFK